MRTSVEWRAAAGIAASLSLAVACAAGCSVQARYRLLTAVFDGVPAPGTPPPMRTPRRVPTAEIAAAPEANPTQVVAEPTPSQPPHFDTYAALVAAFPKDPLGSPDWAAAARAGLVDPRPSPDPSVKAMPPFPLEVRLDPGIPNFQVVFPHAAHTYWLRCDNCHPQIFQMKAEADPITMASIFQGEYCGRCHGKVAFAPATGCPRCHVQMAGPGR